MMPRKDRKAQNAYMRDYRAEAKRRSPQAFKKAQRTYRLKLKYGITREEYDQRLREQGGRCAVCRRPETQKHNASGKTQALAVDHNHRTNKVRGLLCSTCNRGLGYLGDDLLRIRALVDYMEKYDG